jgi:hypothetical protein
VDARVVITTDGEKLSKDEDNLSIFRKYRRRVTPSQRKIIWESTNKRCYICRKPLLIDAFQIEHVVALSKDPSNNDTMGNMLPACADCNQKKSAKSLVDVMNENAFTTNLLTSAATIKHLNSAARNVIEAALDIKHNRNLTPEIIAGKILQLDELLNQYVVTPPEKMHDFFKDVTRQLVSTDITEGKQLGQGGFGLVFAGILKVFIPSTGKWKDNNVAIKRMPYSVTAFREVTCLDRLQHKNLVKYFGYYLDDQCQCLSVVIELCNVSLDTQIKVKDSGFRCASSIANPFKVIYDVCAALSHMHRFDCIHRKHSSGWSIKR